MELTKNQLKQMLNVSDITIEKWIAPLNDAATAYGIDSNLRLAAFIAQIAHESGHFNHIVENLNYSAQGLCKTWPKRFPTIESANPYHRKPEAIANFVYSNRMGNGDEQSGDGWKYRGRGLIQLTGKNNYADLSMALGIDLLADPDKLTEPTYAALSAAWYWSRNDLNQWADKKDIRALTKKINGGLIGIEERTKIYTKCLQALS
jgi:putative chitinase